ncbi:unnamed protein product, partial [Polarella glacialis]
AEFDELLAALAGEDSAFIALDTEFPGFLCEDHLAAHLDLRYWALRENCDLLNPIQLGLAVADKDGLGLGVWTFNLWFDLTTDLHTGESVSFLTAAGVDFPRHAIEGIDPSVLAWKLGASPLLGSHSNSPEWVTFAGWYDWGYLVKLLTGRPMPADLASYEKILSWFCPKKHELRDSLPRGSLDSLLATYSLPRCGSAHTAGSDAVGTLELFFHVRALLADSQQLHSSPTGGRANGHVSASLASPRDQRSSVGKSSATSSTSSSSAGKASPKVDSYEKSNSSEAKLRAGASDAKLEGLEGLLLLLSQGEDGVGCCFRTQGLQIQLVPVEPAPGVAIAVRIAPLVAFADALQEVEVRILSLAIAPCFSDLAHRLENFQPQGVGVVQDSRADAYAELEQGGDPLGHEHGYAPLLSPLPWHRGNVEAEGLALAGSARLAGFADANKESAHPRCTEKFGLSWRTVGSMHRYMPRNSGEDEEALNFREGSLEQQKPRTLEAIELSKRLFTDPDFAVPKPDLRSPSLKWCRPGEISYHDGHELLRQEWQLFRGSARGEDVQPGRLRNSWLTSCLSALADFQGGRLLRQLLPGQQKVSPVGVYLVRLCLGGSWQDVLVDDLFPCQPAEHADPSQSTGRAAAQDSNNKNNNKNKHSNNNTNNNYNNNYNNNNSNNHNNYNNNNSKSNNNNYDYDYNNGAGRIVSRLRQEQHHHHQQQQQQQQQEQQQQQNKQGGGAAMNRFLATPWSGTAADPSRLAAKSHVQLLHCSTRRCQLWASVIEKAFAKACGSYDALASGTCDEALSVLTGWPCTVIHFSREDFDADMLWHALIEGRVDKFLMTCSSADRNDRYQTGLVPSHAYSLLDVTDTRDQNGSRLQLLKLGDPHFHVKRRGAWSDTSHSWPPELRRQLRVSDAAAAGIFFLELSEFLQWFDNCTICRVRDDWTRVDLTTELAGNRVPSEGWVLQVTQPTQCAICLTQPELCTRRHPLQCLGFVLFFFDSATGGARVVASANLHCRAASVDDCCLTPGQLYYLLPLCRPSVRSLPVVCSCSSSRPVVVSQRSFEQSVVQVAWAAFIKCRGSKEASGEVATGGQLSLFGFMSVRNDSEDLRVFVAKTSDGAVVALAENHGLADISVELGFHQSHQRGWRFSRDGPVTCDRVQPGSAQLLQLALPEASWSRAPSFEIRRLRPSQPWHSPALSLDPTGFHQPFQLLPHRVEDAVLIRA